MRARAGYTLLEVAIVNVILVVIVGGGIMAMRASQRSFEQSVAIGVVNAKASRVLIRIARELTGARRGTLVIAAEGDGRLQEDIHAMALAGLERTAGASLGADSMEWRAWWYSL